MVLWAVSPGFGDPRGFSLVSLQLDFCGVDIQIHGYSCAVPCLYTIRYSSDVTSFSKVWVKGLLEVMDEEVLRQSLSFLANL